MINQAFPGTNSPTCTDATLLYSLSTWPWTLHQCTLPGLWLKMFHFVSVSQWICWLLTAVHQRHSSVRSHLGPGSFSFVCSSSGRRWKEKCIINKQYSRAKSFQVIRTSSAFRALGKDVTFAKIKAMQKHSYTPSTVRNESQLPCEDKPIDDNVPEWRLTEEGSWEHKQRVEPEKHHSHVTAGKCKCVNKLFFFS